MSRLEMCRRLVEEIRFHEERRAAMLLELMRLWKAHYDPCQWVYVMAKDGHWEVVRKEDDAQPWS